MYPEHSGRDVVPEEGAIDSTTVRSTLRVRPCAPRTLRPWHPCSATAAISCRPVHPPEICPSMRIVFPFSAIVGQEEMKLALLIAAVDQTVGGVLVFGDRGTGKSTAIRALAALLPPMTAVVGCRYNCDPVSDRSTMPGLQLDRQGQVAASAGPGGRPPAGCHRGSRRRCAGPGARADPRREGVRARSAGPRASRLPVHRRSQPAGGPSRRPAARRGGVGRERGRARRPEHPPPGPIRARRQW